MTKFVKEVRSWKAANATAAQIAARLKSKFRTPAKAADALRPAFALVYGAAFDAETNRFGDAKSKKSRAARQALSRFVRQMFGKKKPKTQARRVSVAKTAKRIVSAHSPAFVRRLIELMKAELRAA